MHTTHTTRPNVQDFARAICLLEKAGPEHAAVVEHLNRGKAALLGWRRFLLLDLGDGSWRVGELGGRTETILARSHWGMCVLQQAVKNPGRFIRPTGVEFPTPDAQRAAIYRALDQLKKHVSYELWYHLSIRTKNDGRVIYEPHDKVEILTDEPAYVSRTQTGPAGADA